MSRIPACLAALALTLALSPAAAFAQEEDDGIGLSLGVGYASAYVWRGANVFSDGEQADQNMLLGPTVTWSVGDTGLYLGWWGGFQLNGSNRAANLESGVGAEQDLYVGYERDLTETLSMNVGLLGYGYPLATEAAAGAEFPFYLDVSAGLGWSGPVDLGFQATWFQAIQSALVGGEHLYLNPTVAYALEPSEVWSLEASLGLGYKQSFGAEIAENRWDVTLLVGAPIAVGGPVWVSPGFGVAWTDLADEGLLGEFTPWGALDVGADF
jgi:uncharacterized protein (TIGR02001 family)